MSESDDPESTIPWPGFVDILSTVIIVFVFFMMMTSVIIFVLSEQAKKDAVQNAKQQSKEDVQQSKDKKETQAEVDQQETKTTEVLKPDVSNLLMEKEALQKEIAKLTQLKNVLSESQAQTLEQAADMITVHFGDMGATITKDTENAIRNGLPSNVRFTIISYIPKDSDFASIREIALNRALNIRNVLLQSNITNDKIDLKIVRHEDDKNLAPTDSVYGSVTILFAQ